MIIMNVQFAFRNSKSFTNCLNVNIDFVKTVALPILTHGLKISLQLSAYNKVATVL